MTALLIAWIATASAVALLMLFWPDAWPTLRRWYEWVRTRL